MRELSPYESVRLIKQLDSGAFLTVIDDNYSVIKTGKAKELSKEEKNIVYNACKSVGIHFFTQMSFKEYSKYADKVDKLLSILMVHGIALTCSIKDKMFYLVFVER